MHCSLRIRTILLVTVISYDTSIKKINIVVDEILVYRPPNFKRLPSHIENINWTPLNYLLLLLLWILKNDPLKTRMKKMADLEQENTSEIQDMSSLLSQMIFGWQVVQYSVENLNGPLLCIYYIIYVYWILLTA